MARSEFRNNALILISGTVLAQSIPVLLQPLLRRVFTPEEFGVYAVYLSLVGIFSVVSGLRYEMAIIIPEKDRDSVALFLGSFLINLCTGILLISVVLLAEHWLLGLLNLKESAAIALYLFPLSMIMLNTAYSANYLLIKKKRFKESSANKIVRRSGEGATQSIAGLQQFSPGLVAGDLIGHAMSILTTAYHIKKAGLELFDMKLREIKYQLKKFSHFPRHNAIPTLLNSVSLLLPVLLISNKYSNEVAGQFDLTRQVLALPLTIISTSISQVLLQKLSEKKTLRMPMRKALNALSKTLLLFTILGLVLFYFFGTATFALVFGEQWESAALYAEILILAFGLKFVVSTISISLTVLEKLKQLAIWQIMYFVLISSLALIEGLDVMDFLKIYLVVELISYIIYYFIIMNEVRIYDRGLAAA